MHRPVPFLLASVFLVATGWAQPPNSLSNAQALTLATQAVQSMTGGQSLQDATLTGTAIWMAGLHAQTGTATLESRGFWQSNLSLSLPSGPWTEVRDSSSGSPAGTWTGADGVQHAMAEHNCWTDPNWFFPALSSLAAGLTDSTVALSYIGPEIHNGIAVQHLRVTRYFANMDPASLALFQALSAVDLYLDSTSLLPDFIDYNAHSDTDENRNFPVEISFSNYQPVSGFVVPFRIQKFFNGALLLDVTVTGATFNTGLPATNF